MDFQGIHNVTQNFQSMFAYHEGFSFQDNLERLVESTNGIVGRVQKYCVTPSAKKTILDSVSRTSDFVASSDYNDLHKDLDERVAKVRGEIAVAAFIDNINVRGRVIEYLITDNGSSLKDQIIKALHDHEPLPQFSTEDKLGDYSKNYASFNTETDIKAKVLFLDGNPKAYNVDKLLHFLATDKSVYMIYLLGIGEDGKIVARLCSIYDKRLIENTKIIHHWAGRNSRGVAQFIGTGLAQIISEKDETTISEELAKEYLEKLIER